MYKVQCIYLVRVSFDQALTEDITVTLTPSPHDLPAHDFSKHTSWFVDIRLCFCCCYFSFRIRCLWYFFKHFPIIITLLFLKLTPRWQNIVCSCRCFGDFVSEGNYILYGLIQNVLHWLVFFLISQYINQYRERVACKNVHSSPSCHLPWFAVRSKLTGTLARQCRPHRNNIIFCLTHYATGFRNKLPEGCMSDL